MPVRSRTVLAIVFAIVVAFGLASRKFDHYFPHILSDHAGDVLWTIAVYITLAWLFPRASLWRLGGAALAISFVVELSQLSDMAWLVNLRKTLPGRLLLGSGFVWIDLVRYTIGATLAVGVDSIWSSRKAS